MKLFTINLNSHGISLNTIVFYSLLFVEIKVVDSYEVKYEKFKFRISEDGVLTTDNIIFYTSRVLCNFNATTIHVYFENETSFGYANNILKNLSDCGTSYISLRNKYRNRNQMMVINDDGIIMYLLLIVKNGEKNLELTIVKRKSADKHRSFIIVLVEDGQDIDKNWLQDAFQKFWNNWILNVVIIFFKNDNIYVYTYSPFSDNFLIKLNSSDIHRDNFYSPKLINMKKHPLRICLFPDDVRAIFKSDGSISGSDGFISSFVANRMNATRVIINPMESTNITNPYGNLLENNTADGCMGHIWSADGDMALNTRFLIPNLFENRVEPSIVYGRDDLCVMVPKAPPSSLFMNIFRSFEYSVWIMIIATLIITYGFYKLSLPKDKLIFLNLFSAILSNPLIKLPTKTKGRTILIFWLGYCLLISNAYKGNLTTNLVFRMSLPEIDTLKDLANSLYPILVLNRHEKYLSMFLNTSQEVHKYILQKSIPVSEDYFLKKLNVNDRKCSFLEKDHLVQYRVTSKKHYRFGRPLYHKMRTCPIPFQSVYIVPYGSPYLGSLNKILRRAHEHGFDVIWSKIMDAEAKYSGNGVPRISRNDDDPVVLKLQHLQAAFVLLGLGLVFAMLVFFYELYKSAYYNKLYGF